MTEQDSNQLKLLREETKAEEKRHELEVSTHLKRIDHLRKEKHKICKRCDHKWPDGTNACTGQFMYSYCKICGLTDL